MPEPPAQESAASDLLRLFRSHKVLIPALTLTCCGAAVVTSLMQDKVYEAKASVAYRDVSQDLGIVGVPAVQATTTFELANAGAQTASDVEVARAAKRRLGSSRSVASLSGSVETKVDGTSGFVKVTASDSSANGAARIANAFAFEAADRTNERARRRFRLAAAGIRRRIRSVSRDSVARASLQERLSNLETLSTLVAPAQVVRRASPPTGAVSPKPLFNGALGLVIGFILALLIAYVRTTLDKRFKGSREVEQHVGLPMIGKVRADALGRSPSGRNGREPLADADVETFRILRRNVDFLRPDSPIKLLAVTSPVASEGKSTVAVALASAAAAAGRRALLVETDLRRPVFADRLGLRPTPGLTDHLAGEAELDEIVQVMPIARPKLATNGQGGEAELSVLVAGSPIAQPDELLGSRSFRSFLERVAERFEFVVFDTSPLLPVADTLELLPLVEGLLLCVRLDQTTRDQTAAAKAALDRLPKRPAGVVVTGTSRAEDPYGYDYGARAR